MLGISWELGFTARKHANALGPDVHRVFVTCSVLTLVIWLCYPIAWGVAEGGNVIAPGSEAVFYGVLDLCAKPVSSNPCYFRRRIPWPLGGKTVLPFNLPKSHIRSGIVEF